MTKSPKLKRAQAEGAAIAALTFIASDADRLSRFLSLSGIDVTRLRAAAAQPEFLAGVLDYLSADEPLLMAFAADAGLDPAMLELAGLLLATG